MQDLINKFQNGQERYNTDPLLHSVVHQLLHGGDPIDIIDNLLLQNRELTNQLKKIVEKLPVQPILIPEDTGPLQNEEIFILKPVEEADLTANDGFHIAFVPFQGFQWCEYFVESKKWRSLITRHTVRVTHVLVKLT